MDSVWSLLLKHDNDILQSSESKSNVFWDQFSLNFRTNDQPTVGLFHARLFGSTMQTLFNLEDIDREYMIRVFFTRHINIRFVKFQQLIDIRTHVPTELGLPARFTFSLTTLASALGHINQPEINMTASLSLKWATESRIQCPFSGHHVAAGVENTAEIRVPIFMISNGSMVWIPPDRIYDLAYYNIKPYTFTSQTKDDSSETWGLAKAKHISTKPPFVSVAQLSLNLRLETTSELPQEDPASAWLNSLMKEYSCDSGHFRLDGFQQRVYRLRYLPKEGALSSVSLSASFNTETIQENADVQYILGVNGSMEWDEDGANDTTSLFRMKDDSIHVYKGGITVHYGNGSMLNWATIEIAVQSLSEENEWNITASGSTTGSVRNWLNSKNIKYLQDERSTTSRERYNNASEPYFQRIHFKIRESEVPLLRYASVTSLFTAEKASLHNVNREKTTKKRCVIHSDHVVTYDGVEYNYTINECHHLLTADCVQKRAKYAIMGKNESHGMVVRITLEKDVIDVSSAGNISINGIEANFTARRMRIHMGEKVIATATLNKENVIHLRLSDEDLDVFVQKSTITLSVGEKLLGHACGMCGDGDSEMTGEFKTSNRCALSSGTLMAASFQVKIAYKKFDV